MILSIDGRPHLEQARQVFEAGKPVFIDKPVAGSLADAKRIFQAAKQHQVPCFSSSSLRFSPGTQAVLTDPGIGAIKGCNAHSPCAIEPHHPDFFWYGIHGVETLFTIMGPGCETVTRVHTDNADLAIGVWKDGRVGTFRGHRTGPHTTERLFLEKKRSSSPVSLKDTSRCWLRLSSSSKRARHQLLPSRLWRSSPLWKPLTVASKWVASQSSWSVRPSDRAEPE